MRVRKSPKKSRWEVEDGGTYLLSSDVHAMGWGVPNPLGGEVLVGKLGFLKGQLPRESPSGICIQERQTSLAHCQKNLLVSLRLTT
jgi:hypothetical protein